MGTTQRVANFIANSRYEELPQPVRDMAKLCLLDVIGCATYASAQPAGKIMIGVVEELGGKPVSHVLGVGLKTNAVNAALVNGTLSHLEDYDDMGNGHHAAVMMPTVLSLGEEHGATGKDVITAYAVGVDITAYTNISLGSDHYAKGWHQTSTAGSLGSAAAASRMLGLNEMQTRMALAVASSQAGGIRAAFGHMAKASHAGNAARAGVLSAKLAARGFEGNPDVIEDRFGFFAAFGEEMASLPSLSRHLGNPWALAKGITLKPWPCCGITHAPATVFNRLLKEHPFKAEDVESIDMVTTYNPSVMAANIRRPKTPLQGKFSPWYTAAVHIVDGKLDLGSFTQEAFSRPVVQDLLKRVSIVQDPDIAGRPRRALGGEEWWDITIKFKNGTSLVADRLHGHGDHYGLDDQEKVFQKFKSLMGRALKPVQADAALNAVMDLEKSSNVSQVVKLLLPN